jgi:hypothetical protein
MKFVRKSVARPAGQVPVVGGVNTASLPEPIELDPSLARPCVTLQGASGSGKTHAIGSMFEAGYNGLVLAAEPKMQGIMRHRPLTVFLGAPVDGRPPTVMQKYDRLMRFRDALSEGKYREHKGKAIDFISTDGFLEIGQIIYRDGKVKRPISKSTGEQNTFALWDKVAEDGVDFFQSCRDAAGLASTIFGFPPVGFVATVGEHIEYSKTGTVRYEPLFPGRKAPEMLPYMFETVIRLACRNNDGKYEFVAHTIGTEEFCAKCPPGVFEPEVINPNFGEMYRKIEEYYSAGVAAAGEVKGESSDDAQQAG